MYNAVQGYQTLSAWLFNTKDLGLAGWSCLMCEHSSNPGRILAKCPASTSILRNWTKLPHSWDRRRSVSPNIYMCCKTEWFRPTSVGDNRAIKSHSISKQELQKFIRFYISVSGSIPDNWLRFKTHLRALLLRERKHCYKLAGFACLAVSDSRDIEIMGLEPAWNMDIGNVLFCYVYIVNSR
jgi:hypothetical protein